MSVWTRGRVERAWGAAGIGGEVPQVADWRDGMLVRAGVLPIILPPPVVMHDPSDPQTWTVPVRWT